MTDTFPLDPRLAADSHPIGEFELCLLRLMDDARYPWLILVPQIAGARELLDLDEGDRRALLEEITVAGRALEAQVRPDRLNIAQLGNQVPQLHVHLVARRHGDAAWPGTVWGHGAAVPYSAAESAARVTELREALRGHLR